MHELDLTPAWIDVAVLAGDDLVLDITLITDNEAINGTTAVNLLGANCTATIYNGNTTIAANVTATDATNGNLRLTWNQTQTASLSGLTRNFYLKIVQNEYDWTPVAGTIQVEPRA